MSRECYECYGCGSCVEGNYYRNPCLMCRPPKRTEEEERLWREAIRAYHQQPEPERPECPEEDDIPF